MVRNYALNNLPVINNLGKHTYRLYSCIFEAYAATFILLLLPDVVMYIWTVWMILTPTSQDKYLVLALVPES